MAWNEQGDNHNDPWGSRNKKNNNSGPPDLDEIFKKFQKIFKNKSSNNQNGSNKLSFSKQNPLNAFIIGLIVAMIIVVTYVWNGLYTVDEKEQAIILRFGQYYKTVGPGLHFYFPGIEKKYQEKVTEYRTYDFDKQMLTEDENIVEVSMSVQYNIANLKDYILNISAPINSLEQATQSALRQVVGSSSMHEVLTEGREVLGVEVQQRLQKYLNSYGAGIRAVKVNVESARPPDQVQNAFDDVIKAREDQERSKNQAQAYSNRVVPEARGQAMRIMEDAQGYSSEVVARALGEASRFDAVLQQYLLAPKVMRERLYLSTMEYVLQHSTKLLLDLKKDSHSMVYLPLDKLLGQTIKHKSVETDLAMGGLLQSMDQKENNMSNTSQGGRQ